MALFVIGILVSAGLYFLWRHDPSPTRRLTARIAGLAAVLFVLLNIFGLILCLRTAPP